MRSAHRHVISLSFARFRRLTHIAPSLIVITLLGLLSLSPARAQVIDTTFDARIETSTFINKQISQMLILPDGKMIASGSFNKYNGRNVGGLVRVHPDGSLDNSFENDLFQTGVSSRPEQIKLLPDGKILVCGSFTLANGTQYVNRVIRLNPNGTVDPSFTFEPIGNAERTVIDPLGRVYAWGQVEYVRNGQTIFRYLVRLNANGTVDDSFNLPGEITNFTTQGNKIVWYVFENGSYQMRRVNEDGSPDNTFTQTAIGGFSFSTFKEQTDHKLVLLRETTLIRVNADGGIDNTFQPPTFNGLGTPWMVVGSDDRMTVRYHSGTAPFGARFIRLLPNGAADPSFTSYLFTHDGGPTWGMHLDGSVMIGDAGSSYSTNTFVKLLPSGQPDPGYNSGGAGFQNIRPGKIRAIRVLPSNKILIGGDFDRVNSIARTKIALLNHNSTLDSSFQINTTATGNRFSVLNDIYEIELQADGKLLISGNFTYFVGGVQKSNVVRLNQDGSIDPSFVLGLHINDHYETSGLSTNRPRYRPDGKILIGNSRTGAPSLDPQPPLQLLSGGARDTGFVPTLYNNETIIVYDLAVLPTGKILITGRRAYLESGTNTITKGVVARLNANGTTDETFQRYERLNKNFVASRVLPDGKILVIHRSETSSQVYRLNEDGSPDGTFNSGAGANGRLNAITVLEDGRIVIGGFFTSYNSDSRRNLAVLDSEGHVLPRNVDTNKEVLCLSVDNDGRVLVGGFFTALRQFAAARSEGEQEVEISYLARLNLVSTGPTLRAPFDFDGDGKTDIGIFRPSVGEWWINRSLDGQTYALQFGASTDRITPADYTGDGKTDVAVFRPSSGEWYVLRSEDFSYFSIPFGTNGDVPVPADYDADGKADFAVFRPSTSTWFISQSSGAPTRIEQFGANGDQPVVSDYDGDGKADVAIFRPAAAEWWINRSTAGLIAMQFGASTDKAVQGDYTGDGKADVAIWRPSTGVWLILRSEDSSFYGIPFGTTGDVIAPGDYDGDGKFDPTVFRPSSATWFIARTTAGTLIAQFGANGDQPVANAFVP
jgi:uncharacterized delta-60 repeat protein